MDLKPTWLIYKFCSIGGNHTAKLGMVCGVAGGNNLFSAPPPLWEPAQLVGTPSPVKQFLDINFMHVRVRALAEYIAMGILALLARLTKNSRLFWLSAHSK